MMREEDQYMMPVKKRKGERVLNIHRLEAMEMLLLLLLLGEFTSPEVNYEFV